MPKVRKKAEVEGKNPNNLFDICCFNRIFKKMTNSNVYNLY